jgi:class 3 adenylate cyclase/tetratricopeptide (TPR) repeat protein
MECAYDLKRNKDTATIDYSKPKSYTPKHLAEKILTTRSSIEGERKIVTVLFADVANYTSMSEKLDPEEVLQIMDGAFKIMMDETHKYEGTINQFTGDGIMAIFGAPVAHENHAQRACYTALSIQNAMVDYSEQIQKKYGVDFKIRIGLNSGAVIVSAIGDDLRMDYTAVGDTTNLAARMESLAKPGTIYVSENTRKIVDGYFEFDHLGKTEVKGKEQPQDIYELIKAGEVLTRIDASIAKGLTRFVGRKNSMAALMDVYDRVKTGQGQVVGIVGEAGVGKSRLILEFKNSIVHENHGYLEGQCLQYGGSILYKPILDILKTLFEIKDLDREHVIKKKIKEKVLAFPSLEQSLPSFQDLLSVQVDDEAFLKLEPKQKRGKAFEAIRDLLVSISQESPLVLVVEDLHWIDDSSEEFLNYLIEWIASSPVMLILLYRTEYQHKWSSKTYYHKIGLDHLGKDSAIELVTAMLEDGDVTPELRDLILSRAAGNPLFMEEFTQSLVENGTIQKQDNRYILSRKITEIHVPDTVQGIIAARMDRLEENLKRTMQVASVIGRDFAFRILQTITGMREELKSYLLNLQGLEFIYEKRLFPELEYIFKHALTQEVAYNSLLLKRRKQIHENIGKAIEDLYSERLEEFYEMLAYHYSKSYNLEKACHYLKLSGIKATVNYANQESYNFYKEAIELLKRLPDTEENKKEQIEIVKLIHRPMRFIGYPENSLEILENGKRLSKEIRDRRSLASFVGIISLYYEFKGKPLEGIQYCEPIFYEAYKDRDIDLLAPLSMGLVSLYGELGHYFKTLDVLPGVLDLMETNSRQNDYFDMPFNLYSYLCYRYAQSLFCTGHFEQAEFYIHKGQEIAIENNDPVGMNYFYHYFSAYFFLFKQNFKRAVEHSQKAFRYAEKYNYKIGIALAFMFSGWGYYYLGDMDAAWKRIEKGYALQKDNSLEISISSYPLLFARIQFDIGHIDKALGCAREAIDLSITGSNQRGEGCAKLIMGRALGQSKMPTGDEAEIYILEGIRILEGLQLRFDSAEGYFYLGELYGESGNHEKALDQLKTAEAEYQDMGIDYSFSLCRSLLAKTLSKTEPSRFNEAEQTLFDSLKIARNMGSKPCLAYGHLCLGEIYADNGQKEKSIENLKKAESMYEKMKMGLWLGKTKEILDRL